MKLYYTPGVCSVGIHILLEEIGKPYQSQAIDFSTGEQYQPAFAALNPKNKVPLLERDDGSVLTEFGAIATWLARTNPDAHLLPDDPDLEARAVEALDYIVGTLHMQGFSRIFRPANFTPDEAGVETVKARGREIFTKGLTLLEQQLAGRDYLVGTFSTADAALFYICLWAGRVDIALPPNVAAHFARMKQRPAVQRVMQAEGLA